MHRRDVLETGCGLAVLSAVGMAGCLHGSSDDDEESHLDWLVAPEEIGVDDYRVLSTAPSAVAEYSAELTTEIWDSYRNIWLDWEVADPEPTNVERLTVGQNDDTNYTVALHDIDTDTLADNLEMDGFEDADEYEGFSVYTRDDTDARALEEGVLVSAEDDEDARLVVESLIDSSLGNTARYHEENDDLEIVLDTLETDGNFRSNTYQQITDTISQQGVFAGSVARGQSTTLEADHLAVTRLEVLVDDTDIREEDIDSYVDTDPLFYHAEDVDHRVEGNQLIIEFEVSYDVANEDQLG